MTNIFMPQLGESVTEGTVRNWLKRPGETVTADEAIAEIETDKISFEVPAPNSGTLDQILVEVGQTATVGDIIGKLVGEDSKSTVKDENLPSKNSNFHTIATNPSIKQNVSQDRTLNDPDRPLSPAVRKLVRENNIDTFGLVGSGKNGRLTKSDILEYLDSEKKENLTAHETTSIQIPAYLKPVALPGDEVISLSPIRQRTAEHMVFSTLNSPQGYISYDVDYGNVEKVRNLKKDAFREAQGHSLTYLPFVCYAVVDAIQKFPLMNSVVDGDHMIIRKNVNISIPVDLDFQGLTVPVLKNAERLKVQAIACAIFDLANRARSGNLNVEDVNGGTFTITNPGPAGTRVSVPIINQPQSAILVTDGIERRPCVVSLADGSEGIVIRPIGNIGVSIDHRAFDGAYAASFLRTVKMSLETNDWASLL